MIAGILLAAGRGERFGGGKLLARLRTGRTILETSAANMRAALSAVTIVIRDDAELVLLVERLAKEIDVRVVINPDANDGMATSIGAGVGATANVDGWLIGLADMPLITSTTIQLVARNIQTPSSIVIPTYQRKRGHPVGFGRDYFAALTTLRGDAGARSIVQTSGTHVQELEVPDPGVLVDIDTRDDLQGF